MRLLIVLMLFLIVCGFGAVTFLAFGLTWGSAAAGIAVVTTFTLASCAALVAWCCTA